jgi:hypothetical protein
MRDRFRRPWQVLRLLRRPRELRYDSDAPALILPRQAADFRFAHGHLLSIWQSGLKLACPRAMRRGLQVAVKVGHAMVFGKVRSCRSPLSGIFEIEIWTQRVDMARSPSTTKALQAAVGMPNSHTFHEYLVEK